MIVWLVEAVAQAGVRVDRALIVNCYVAMKSKPLTILAGPQHGGKVLLVKNLTQMLAQDIWQNQMMLGHDWSAERTGNKALFTEAQTRLNSSKILALIEEASLQENGGRVFMGWMNRIGPTELAGFFSDLAFQLQHKGLMRLPGFHLAEPVLWPCNFSLLGTMDTARFDWPGEDLFSQTTIIPWPPAELSPPAVRRRPGPIIPDAERVFLHSRIRSEEAAFDKLHRIQGWRSQQMWPLVVVEDLLVQHGVDLPGCAMGEGMIYVANAWSVDGEGLFDPAPTRNLALALDFAITQSLLVRAGEAIRDSAILRARLAGMLTRRFPCSAAFLRTLQQEEAMGAVRRERVARNDPFAATNPISVALSKRRRRNWVASTARALGHLAYEPPGRHA